MFWGENADFGEFLDNYVEKKGFWLSLYNVYLFKNQDRNKDYKANLLFGGFMD